ncbi:MAG: DNA primase [Chloroflexi bacterium 13_1_40CM_4_68_4]|nr:MAG: DNA primase [Chloroflexi bacterium 13_1_40CM_4_68_4]
MPGDFDLVKERIDIVALIGERVPLKRAGRVYKGLCPFHSEKTPSFQVDPERRNYKCFGCGESGDVFTWLEKQEHLEPVEALKVLAERAGVELSGSRRTPEDKAREDRLRKLMDTAHFYFTQGLRSPDHGKVAAAYLANRGMTQAAIDKFGLGYAPDLWDGLLTYIKKKGFSEEEGITAGLLRTGDRGAYDWFRGRLMVPIKDSRGRVIAFGGRAMRADQPGKYVNSPNTSLFNKSATLYALDLAKASIRKESTAVIVEGYFDTIASHQAGITNVVASMGTALTQEQYLVLQDMKLERIVVAFDGDPAGQRSAEKRGRDLLPLLQRHSGRAGSGEVGTRGFGTLFVTVLPGGMDPDDLARADAPKLRTLIAEAQSLLDFLIAKIRERSRLDQNEGRLRFLGEVAALLASEPDPVRREVYLSTVATDTGVDPTLLRRQVEAALAAPPAPGFRPQAQPSEAADEGGDRSEMKQTPLQERYVMALLTRFPEEIARVDLVPDDLGDPDLRALLKELQAGKRPSSDLPAHLAATAAALGAAAPELGEETDPRQAIEIAAQRLRVQRLRVRLGETRAKLAQLADGDVSALAAEVGRLATDLEAAMARVERRTVLHGDTERREGE